MTTSYNSLAPIYDMVWGDISRDRYLSVLLNWIGGTKDSTIRVLDLACGSGQLAQALHTAGYKVSGADAAPALIDIAQKQVPDATFQICQMESLDYSACDFDVVLCIFDSINHIEPQSLPKVFSEVWRVLRPNGQLIFDVNTRQGFKTRWAGEHSVIRDDLVYIARANFDEINNQALMKLTTFSTSDRTAWTRKDLLIEEWVHPHTSLAKCLRESGFDRIETHESTDLGNARDVGRTFYRSFKTRTGSD